jgi:cytochrome o ubiquinol oxidase operon protein cyoD
MTDTRFDRAPGDSTVAAGREGNVLALALGVLIVILVAAGSIFIMANLNEIMMPSPELMTPHMRH